MEIYNYIDFFHKLRNNSDNLSSYVDSLYNNTDYTEDELNSIFGLLRDEGLIAFNFYSNRAYAIRITTKGKRYMISKTTNTPRLIELIDETVQIEKEFHVGLMNITQIRDSQIFQNWIEELKYELNSLYYKKNDFFIKETIDLISDEFNGFKDRSTFNTLKAKLDVIKKNKNKYFSELMDEKKESNAMSQNKQPLIFISHSSKNKEAVKLLTELLFILGLKPKKQVFCSSIPGYDIPIDYKDGIFEFLREMFEKHYIHAIFIHSPEYYKSHVSLNEMGAAWVLKTTQTSFLLPGFDFSSMTGVINDSKIAIKLDNDITEVKDKLNQLRKQLEEEFSLESIDSTIWEQKRDQFIKEINELQSKENDTNDK